MIISKCPLRISLAGGSTDLQEFIDRYGRGSVLSFPCDIYTYISLFSDVIGFNTHDRKYIIDYTKHEMVDSNTEIANDIAREVLTYFSVKPIKMSFYADIFSFRCGLASSSSYTIAAINAVNELLNLKYTNFKMCDLAVELERKFNPLAGYQDFFGCGIGGLKRIDFHKNAKPTIRYVWTDIFNNIDMWLLFSEVTRESTNVLKTLDMEKCKLLLDNVDKMEDILSNNNMSEFINVMKTSWIQKKETSPKILGDDKRMHDLDAMLSNNKNVLCHKLCGAGGGGYFLVFTAKDKKIYDDNEKNMKSTIKIGIDEKGTTVQKI